MNKQNQSLENKRATIKDIAKIAGVSVGSVHYALMGKEGVSEETRQNILGIARQINYSPNSSAAALKRRQLTIAAIFPGTSDESHYYFTGIWQGIRDFFKFAQDLNIKCIESSFKNGINSDIDEWAELFESSEVDGLLTVGFLDGYGKISIRRFVDKNIPVILIDDDLIKSGRLCCVQPEYRINGRMLAEFITKKTSGNTDILLWAGDWRVPSHYTTIKGFDSYLKYRGLKNRIYKLYSSGNKTEDQKNILHVLKNKKPGACFSVNARGSVILGNAIKEANLTGKIFAVGSDIFKENLRFLKDGIFTSLLHKNTYLEAYAASKYLVDYLVKDIRPAMDIINVGSELVFQSNASMFKNGFSRLLL